MKRLLFLGLSLACLLTWGKAAIPINSVQTFATLPLASDWTTMTNGGSSSTIVTGAAMDAVVQTNVALAITSPLQATTTPGTSPIPRWHSTAQYLQSRPSVDAYLTLMATIQNTSAGNRPSVVVSYDFGNPVPVPDAEDSGLNGLRAYYSLTGTENSWTLIPEFTAAIPGQLLTTLNLGSWPAGGLLYLLWVDDNGSPGTDGAFSIDNFLVSLCLVPPLIIQQPVSTNVLQGRTVRLTAVYSGGCGGTVGAMYQWFKVGVGPLDPSSNPSAVTATLVITNAQLSDTGDYFLVVNGIAGSVTSATRHVEVLPDTQAPKLLAAHVIGPGLNAFRLVVDEPLCVDSTDLGCGSDPTLPFNWEIQDFATLMNLGVETATVNGTNIDFTTVNPRTPGHTYRIVVSSNEGISDLFGNHTQEGTFVETVPAAFFKQGLAGYSGTQDAEVHSQAGADTPFGAAPSIRVDSDEAGVAQALIRFDNIFGNGVGQLPFAADITSATLRLNQLDPGADIHLHRMLINWDQTAVTWNSLGDGLAADDLEVASAIEAALTSGVGGDYIEVDVTSTVRRWAEGYPNNGWALLPTGSDGFQFASSESSNAPMLAVEYYGHVDVCSLSFVTQPIPSLVVTEGQSFTLFAGVSGFSPVFQWTKNGMDIPGATGPSLTIQAAKGECAAGGGDAGTYRLRMSCPNDSITSGPAVVTVLAEVTFPRLTKAISLTETTIVLTFSKKLSASSAENASNYLFTPLVEITSVALSNGPANATVTLRTAPRAFPTAYTLRVASVTDDRCASTPLHPNPTVISLTSLLEVMGYGGGSWKYATNTQDASLESGSPWFSPDFDDSAWLSGQGFFGFEPSAGVADALPPPKLMTPLPPNSDAVNPNAFVTTYFRRSVSLPAIPTNAVFALCHYIDDGASFYLDGKEIGRWSMPAGSPLFVTRANALPTGESTLQCLLFAASEGTHTLAVEVHQAGLTSSDVLFGAEIRAIHLPPPLTIQNLSGMNVISWTADTAWGLGGSQNVSGPYTAASVISLGNYTLPPAAQTNQSFYRLHYTGRP